MFSPKWIVLKRLSKLNDSDTLGKLRTLSLLLSARAIWKKCLVESLLGPSNSLVKTLLKVIYQPLAHLIPKRVFRVIICQVRRVMFADSSVGHNRLILILLNPLKQTCLNCLILSTVRNFWKRDIWPIRCHLPNRSTVQLLVLAVNALAIFYTFIVECH